MGAIWLMSGTFILYMVATFPAETQASGDWTPATSWEASSTLKPLLSEVEESMGATVSTEAQARHAPMEELMRPVYEVMPKNEYGNLGHEAARYFLHRFFVQRHGWFVKGLHTEGGAWNSSSPSEFFRGHVPPNVQGLFERRLAGRGLSLHSAAVMAAMLEQLVYEEQRQRLVAVVEIFGYAPDSKFNRTSADAILDLYMAAQLKGFTSEKTKRLRVPLMKHIARLYPGWPQLAAWLREVTEEVYPGRDSFVQADMVEVVKVVGARHGRWQDYECRDMQKKLVGLGDHGAGCVDLADFYNATSHGNEQFQENPDILREHGIIEESDPALPHVLVANYINSPTNCAGASSYYEICCINHCEEILAHFEGVVKAPMANTDQILDAVTTLPANKASKHTKMTRALLDKLNQIAARDGGMVPLHGRLFALWLHLVYPRECPYPHLSGATHQTSLMEYSAKKGRSFRVTEQEANHYLNARRNVSLANVGQDSACSKWDEREEFLMPLPAMPATLADLEDDSEVRTTIYFVSFLSATVSIAILLYRTWTDLVRQAERSFKLVEV